jgi:hypothetical protein
MQSRLLIMLLGLGLVLGMTAAAPAPHDDPKPDGATINLLIAQLGSGDYDDRRKAGDALEDIGEPALGALREAVNSADERLGQRAEVLVGKIEERADAEILKKSRRVHLHFKDAPLREAFEAFRKESGYDLALNVPNDKLRGRTVTLDTDAVFWEAFDAFCEKAGLREAGVSELTALHPSYSYSSAGASIAVERITLNEGKPEDGPTDDASVVRIRALKPPHPAVSADGNSATLLLSLEPRLQWLSIDEVKVAKAVDDQGQELGATDTDVTPSNPTQKPPTLAAADGEFMGGGVYRRIVIHLGQGAKPARSLTELRGTIRAVILGKMSVVLSVPKVLKVADKTFKGGGDGLLRVISASKNDAGKITVRLELRSPSRFVPPCGEGVPREAAAGIAAEPDGRFMGPGLGHALTNSDGIGLMDDKGNNILVSPGGVIMTAGATLPGPPLNRFVQVLCFQAEKGQEPSKLVYCGREVLTVEIPFSLKDVPLP